MVTGLPVDRALWLCLRRSRSRRDDICRRVPGCWMPRVRWAKFTANLSRVLGRG